MIKRAILTALIAFVGSLAFVYLQSSHPPLKMISPMIDNSKLPTSENIWTPKLVQPVLAEGNAPDITAKAAFFIDTHTGEVLYQKDIHERMPIASLTKIMTVIVAMETASLDKVYTVSQAASDMEPDHMGLIPGEEFTLEELLDGVFMDSANDAAEVIAEGSVGSRDEFIKLMNEETKRLGMNDTLFINPTGLDEDGRQQYSSAYDVALMARYAITRWPHLVDISSQAEIDLPESGTHRAYYLPTGISLVTTYPGVVGFKIGYTPEAGYTIVTLARKDGHEVLGVLLNSDDRRNETRELLDYVFGKLQ